jgi:glycosyltransferase involved in cell wall biosynthesis
MTAKKTKVVFAPNWSKNNPYQKLLAASVSSEYEVVMENYPQGLQPFTGLHNNTPEMKVLHIHWIAELVQRLSWSKSSLLFYVKLSLLSWDLIRLKRRGVKVIWTIHNKLSHQGLDENRELIINRRFCSLVDKVILHSEEAKTYISEFYQYPLAQKANVIFHGNYQGSYPHPSSDRQTIRNKLNIEPDNIQLLYFGSIRPYKGVDTLIKSFNALDSQALNIKLSIAGGVPDPEYKNSLQAMVQDKPNISAIFDFIPEQQLIDLIEAADIVVIPFVDTLTSGSTILAMTQGKALILPDKATIFGCVPEDGVRYFADCEQLTQLLYTLHELPIKEMAQSNLNAAKFMDWKKIGQLTIDCYNQ